MLLPVKPAPPAAFEETTLAQLSAAVDSVYTATSSSLSQEELYRAVESLCLHNKQSDLYSRLCQQCELHIATALGTLATDTSLALPDLPYLTHVASIWEGQCTRLLTLRSVFLYLDRSYVLHLPNVHSLWEMGLQIVRKHFLQQQQQLDPNTSATPTNQSAVESKTRQALLTLIEKERQGETVPRSLLRTLLRMYASLHLYSTLFEPALLAATSTFYTTESAQLLSSFSLSDYLHHVTTRVQQEHDRLSSYLDPSSTSSLISLVESRLIAAHTTAMIQVGFAQLCSESKEAELAVMYGLFSAVGALDELKTAFANYVKERGTTIVSNEEKEAVMVTELLALKAQLDRLLVGSFASSASFHDAVRMSFLSFLNSRENKPAEMIARHLDQLLRSGGTKGKTADEVESDIVATLWLFRHIQSKDVFQAFYKKDLARRLLLGRSASVDAEKSVIDKLRAECGSSFTAKLEGMFKDMELSKDIQTAFAQHLRTMANAPAVEISVSVLTTGSWPAYGEVEMRLPDEVRRVQDEFKLFYVNSHSGRKLAWQDSLSTAILRAHFPRGKKELQVNGMQAIVLMCFNPSERKTGERKVKDEGKEEAVASTLSLSSSSTSTTAASPTSPYPILTFTQLLDMTKLPAPELKRVSKHNTPPSRQHARHCTASHSLAHVSPCISVACCADPPIAVLRRLCPPSHQRAQEPHTVRQRHLPHRPHLPLVPLPHQSAVPAAEGDQGGEQGRHRQSVRGPPVRHRCGHSAHHEGEEADGPWRADERGDQRVCGQVSGEDGGHQEEDWHAYRQRVHGAR